MLSAKLRILSAAENRHPRKFTSLRWKGELSPLSPLFESTPVCYTVGIEWVIVMDVLNLNSIRYVLMNYKRKMILSKDDLSAYVTKYIYY